MGLDVFGKLLGLADGPDVGDLEGASIVIGGGVGLTIIEVIGLLVDLLLGAFNRDCSNVFCE